jgi:hypothetical protein
MAQALIGLIAVGMVAFGFAWSLCASAARADRFMAAEERRRRGQS